MSARNLRNIVYNACFFGGLFALMSLSGCTTSTGLHTGSATQTDMTVEPLYGVDIKDKAIWVLVKSTGCTTAESFSLSFTPQNQQNSQYQTLTVNRTRPDRCRAMPELKGINIPLDNNQQVISTQTKIIITNPFMRKMSRSDKARQSTR